ncbi:nickel-binding protein [Saccharicrinis sp. 156]|uniref:nickel-binding protein n=1 Tax=Saccharicrinis sp. 156 TaxID=3417574 RepID=UPI003D3595AD
MPIFMDRHDVSESVTAEIVAQLHQEDLKIQHRYDCRGLTYWFDDIRKTAFCLVEAPDRDAINQMHADAHGEVPHQIIEVDAAIVESFLGRIEDPAKAQDTKLNIINDPAFRTIMMVTIENHSFKISDPFSAFSNVQQYYKQILSILNTFNGNIVRQNKEGFLISFRTVQEAVLCALKIHENYRSSRTQYQIDFTELHIGLHAGIPVTNKKSIFEDTIKLAQRMCFVSIAAVVISTEVQQLFESENIGEDVNGTQFHVLTPREEKFLTSLMEFTEKEWQNPELKVEDFEINIGISKSKLYREMIRLTGKSPNVFLLHFRLRKSLRLLQKQKGNVSEVAYNSGFNSPSYYTKCFRKKYRIMPSELVQL